MSKFNIRPVSHTNDSTFLPGLTVLLVTGSWPYNGAMYRVPFVEEALSPIKNIWLLPYSFIICFFSITSHFFLFAPILYLPFSSLSFPFLSDPRHLLFLSSFFHCFIFFQSILYLHTHTNLFNPRNAA